VSTSAASKYLAGILFGALFITTLGAFGDSRPILIRSLESRSSSGGPVYNRIRYLPGLRRDLWFMQQSHDRLDRPLQQWDRVAISVDHLTSKASFIQYQPGDFESALKPAPLRASCLGCHPGGPRVIRPADPGLGAWDRMRLFFWNFRISCYGRLASQAASDAITQPVAFRPHSDHARLPIRVCLDCHNDSPWGRGALSRENAAAIDFMTANGLMPPTGLPFSAQDRKAIWRFTRGL
jgi:hypothetical protein